jgi:two-component system heavy metal sensor histidine kinase CusS
MQLGMDTAGLARRLTELRHYLFLAVGVVAVLAAAGGWFLASRSLVPFRELVDELARIRPTDLGARLIVQPGTDENSAIRNAINHLLERLETAFTSLRSFTSNAAHELRSPLAAAICELDVSASGARSNEEVQESVAQATGRLRKMALLVESLLFLARMDARAMLDESDDVDILELVQEVCEPFAIQAEEAGIVLTVQGEAHPVLQGEPSLLRRMFGNVLENALRHTDRGGTITVTVTEANGTGLLTVTDTGEGVPEDAIPHVFERFSRTDTARAMTSGGAGIGLSIVKRIAELHGGHVTLTSELGRGTTVSIVLPLSQA